MRKRESAVKIGTIVVVLFLIAGVFYLRGSSDANLAPSPQPVAEAPTPSGQEPALRQSDTPVRSQPVTDTPVQRELPQLVDLGAQRCVPCRMMAPILEDLKVHYADRFKTTFVDVWQDPAAGELHGVRLIPTQIFFDPKGRELFRHEGFFSKDDILATWRRLGYPV